MSREKETAEARCLSRYLLGSDAAPALIDRYVQACTVLFPVVAASDAGLLALALRRPVLLAPIDSALALLRPKSVLRQKLLLMAAILETTPEYADRFLPRAPGIAGLVALVAWVGLKSALLVPIGALVIWASERSR